jgi:predicted Zn-ribbon and HTH transcriptional regulator
MILKEVEVFPGLYLYRCGSCGFEYPHNAVKKPFLGKAPIHSCQTSVEPLFHVRNYFEGLNGTWKS